MRLAGKVALITGAGSGIGREAAVLFGREGASVVAVDVNAAAADETAALVEKEGGTAHALTADVSRSADCEAMVAVAERELGGLHVLWNNAGIMLSADHDAVATDEAVWEQTMEVNAKGVFLGCKHGIPALRRAGGGSIINTASFVALMGAATPQIAYTASKGAVLSLTRELAVIHARENIRVNAICPGPLRTELLMKVLDTDEKKQRRLVRIPMGRFGEAAEIAKAALFLASDESSFMTGASLVVDGGITAAYVSHRSEAAMTLQRRLFPHPSQFDHLAREDCAMKVFICASRSNYHRVPSIQRELERRDHLVTLPNNYDDPGREERIKSSTPSEYRRWKARMLEMQREKVRANDAVLVLNFDKGESRNYLGGATFLEVFKAWELGRRIFFFNPLPDGILRDELDAMSPVVIDGDFSLVS